MKCGATEKKIGQAEVEFKNKSMSHYLHQLKNFLEEDIKTITVCQLIFHDYITKQLLSRKVLEYPKGWGSTKVFLE